MKAANLAGAVLGAILKVAFAVIVVYLVYTGASTCYDYGYRILRSLRSPAEKAARSPCP